MAEVIQFNCPSCGTMLRLPISMASQQGPCPTCNREIMAPDPYRGIGAFEIPKAPPAREIEPFRPFAESPPLVPKTPEAMVKIPEPTADVEKMVPLKTEAEQPPVAVTQATVCAKPQLPILVLSCLLTGAVTLAWGFALGVRSKEYFAKVPPPTSPTIPSPPIEKPVMVVEPPNPTPPPLVVKTISNPAQAVKPPETGNKVSSAAEASLQAFLEAPDWAARSAYVLFPDRVRTAMEAYSREVPDGPTAYKSISVKQSHIDEKTGSTLFIFLVITNRCPVGIPVAIKETPSGWLVDWQAFVEFRDGLFNKFVEGPVDKSGRFHVVVTRPSAERAANTENVHFASFLLKSPMEDKAQLVFIRKASETFTTFQTATASGETFTPILDVVKRKTSSGQGYLEVVGINATNWLPAEN